MTGSARALARQAAGEPDAHSAARQTLDSLRADPALVYREEAQAAESLSDRFWRAVGELIDLVFGGDAGYLTRPVLYVVLGAVVLWVVLLLVRSERGVMRRSARTGRRRAEHLPDDITETDYAALAARAEASGALREALRWRFLDVLQRLDADGLSPYRADKTDAEHLAELPAALRPPFASLARRFERVWYGGYDVTPQDYERVRADVRGLTRAEVPA